MFGKLRLKFVLFTMLAVTVVLAVIMTLVNVMNFGNVTASADEILNNLEQNGGAFSPPPGGDRPDWGTAETPYETRFFSVVVDDDNKIVAINTSMIAAVDAKTARAYALAVLYDGSSRGYMGGIYRYIVGGDGVMQIIFMDCSRLLAAANDFLWTSIWISLAGIAMVALFVTLISKRVVSPISESYKKQKEFITNASHELKTPLTIISADNELTELEVGESESTRSISRQVARMTAMVKNMSTLAKIDELSVAREMSRFSLSAALGDCCRQYTAAAETRGLTFTVDIADGINCVGNENLVRQLAGILLDNAIKYGLTRISVRLTGGKKAEWTVENDASGVERESMGKVFDRFYRAASARASAVEGSGIGLSVARDIARLHKWQISAHTTDGNDFIVAISM